MRVGIYIYESTTIHFGEEVSAVKYGEQVKRQLSGPVTLEPGIYSVDAEEPQQIKPSERDLADVITIHDDKDQWPDPRLRTMKFGDAFPNVSVDDLRTFFPVTAKGFNAPIA